MGGGYHGGFGDTSGNQERLRIGRPVSATEKNYRMALDPEYYIGVIAKKYNIHLHLGMTSVKVDASVTAWPTTGTNADVNLPNNN